MVDALDDLDRQLLETENALQAIEAQLHGPAVVTSPRAGQRGRALQDQLPGRWCRASALPTWRTCPRTCSSSSGAKGRSQRGTFATEARFPAKRITEEEVPFLHPSHSFLSTSTVSKGAIIAPPESLKPRQIQEARRWLKHIAAEANSKEAAAHLATPGLEGVAAAWQALLKEEDACQAAGDDFLDDASTSAGSELSELLSVGSAEPPGPGAYEPKFDALRPSLAKGAPSFDRYKGREPQEPEAIEEAELPPPPPPAPEKSLKCRGGKILPLPKTQPRRGTEGQRDADAAARRPLCYDGWASERVEVTMPVATLGPPDKEPHSGHAETGRLVRLQVSSCPGPGDYEAPELLPGPSALMAPEPPPKEEKATPGPASYDLRQSQAHIYPRGFAADLGAAREDPAQRAPAYVSSYGPLDPRWETTRARSPSAAILPEESYEALRAQALMRGRAPPAGTGVRLGPGAYDGFTDPLLRPDLAVLPWRPLRSGLPEHLHAMFRLRPDSRIILPLPKAPLRRSWSAGDIWRFYLPELDAPLGLASFARNLAFDDWQELEARHARHMWPNLRRLECSWSALGVLRQRLSYSLPDLHVTHERAPEADFGQAQGRDEVRLNEDEEVEGDAPEKHRFDAGFVFLPLLAGQVLLLSLEAGLAKASRNSETSNKRSQHIAE
ncbi:unnamed protein product [Symbiodinium natans]|uniref:Uncharacterized protein n=1 Tax=Symbiodinium natans TaxID=878477 RepID=A0A812SZ58_9DINO|nr:unnamed protein product [Symbiodinium natans]